MQRRKESKWHGSDMLSFSHLATHFVRVRICTYEAVRTVSGRARGRSRYVDTGGTFLRTALVRLDIHIQGQEHVSALCFQALSGAVWVLCSFKTTLCLSLRFPSDQHQHTTVWVITVTTVAKEVM